MSDYFFMITLTFVLVHVASGNLLFLAFVSHFGAKMHRPRLIGMGCFLMAIGSALTGLPHFFMGRYKTWACTALGMGAPLPQEYIVTVCLM